MTKNRPVEFGAIFLLCGLVVMGGLASCSLSGAGGTGRSGRMTGRVRLPFNLFSGGSSKRLDCDSETERIRRVDGELVCVAVEPEPSE